MDAELTIPRCWVLGQCVAIGTNDEGNPRVLVHATEDELGKGPNLIYREVVVMELERANAFLDLFKRACKAMPESLQREVQAALYR